MCGDGLVTFNEQCDDGNLVVGDGCDASCVVESWNGWQCVRVPVDGVTQVEGVRISYTSACTLMDA
jgi:cysteine-rich repeat protein